MNEQPSRPGDQSESNQVTGYFVQVPQEKGDNSHVLPALRRQLRADRWLIVGILGVCTLIAALVALTSTPVYQAEVLLAPASAEDNQNQLAALIGQYAPGAQLGGLGSGSDTKDQAIAILRSRKFTEEFIKSENVLPVIYADRWDAEKQQWKNTNAVKAPKMSEAIAIFDESIRSIREDSRRNLVTLRIRWTDPAYAAKWANKLIERLNDHLRERDIAEAGRSIEFLNQELEKSSVIELRQGIYRLIESQIELVMLANVRKEYAFKILDPAVPAEPEDYVRPRRLLIVLVGIMVGLLIAMIAAISRADWEQ